MDFRLPDAKPNDSPSSPAAFPASAKLLSNTTLNQIKRFRQLITKPDIEAGLLEEELRIQKNAVFELRKISDRLKALFIKLQA